MLEVSKPAARWSRSSLARVRVSVEGASLLEGEEIEDGGEPMVFFACSFTREVESCWYLYFARG